MRTYKTTGYKKRQYEDVARIIGENSRLADPIGLRQQALADVTGDFVALFSRDNDRFDESRFRARIDEYATGKR